ncbi:MAG: hypothetical protein AAF288_01065 [Planctomycetota bacterium]
MRKTAKTVLTSTRRTFSRLHRDERGAEGLEKLLILAAVALPLLAVLLFFGQDIKEYLTNSWTDVTDADASGSGGGGLGGNPGLTPP